MCRTPDGAVTDLTPAPFNVRTRAHEYGGGAFGVGNGVVVFANFADQRVYRLEAGRGPPTDYARGAPPIRRLRPGPDGAAGGLRVRGPSR